ncbi:MAG: TRAP transporter large permease subunit [Pirellulaceae bacterium]
MVVPASRWSGLGSIDRSDVSSNRRCVWNGVGVMFRYVFLFVLFGAFLQASGATGYIIGLAVRLFGKRAGWTCQSLGNRQRFDGLVVRSAVANAATTGTFTIPLMRSIGFKPHIAAGVEAAASSGGALVPPVMGAGAYMMLEIINRDPAVTYLEICQAAFIPACLYYLSIFMLVHFYARKIDVESDRASARLAETHSDEPSSTAAAVELAPAPAAALLSLEGLAFFGSLGGLMGFLLVGFSPFRAVTYALAIVIGVVLINPATPVNRRERYLALVVWALLTLLAWYIAPAVSQWGDALVWSIAGLLLAGLFSPSWWGLLSNSFRTTAQGGPYATSSRLRRDCNRPRFTHRCVGTGVPQAIIPLAGNNLFLGLVAIMFCSLVLGMACIVSPSPICSYDHHWPRIRRLEPGCAHSGSPPSFHFLLRMMAMVTPPGSAGVWRNRIDRPCQCDAIRDRGVSIFVGRLHLPSGVRLSSRPSSDGNDGGSPLAMDVVIAVQLPPESRLLIRYGRHSIDSV